MAARRTLAGGVNQRDAQTVHEEQSIKLKAAEAPVTPIMAPTGGLSKPALVAAAALASAVAIGMAVAVSGPGRERLAQAARLLRESVAAQGEDPEEFIDTLQSVLAAAQAEASG